VIAISVAMVTILSVAIVTVLSVAIVIDASGYSLLLSHEALPKINTTL
jgi:hypothetical protein